MTPRSGPADSGIVRFGPSRHAGVTHTFWMQQMSEEEGRLNQRRRRLRGALWLIRGLAMIGLMTATLSIALTVVSTGWVMTWRGRVPLVGLPDVTVNVNRGMIWTTTGGSFSSPGFDTIRLPSRAQQREASGSSLPLLRWWPQVWWQPISQTATTFEMPLWLVALTGTVCSLAGWRGSRRVIKRLLAVEAVTPTCPRCGYARRGLSSGSVCPECGATPEGA